MRWREQPAHARLSGVAAPEIEHEGFGISADSGGQDATTLMRELVRGQTVVCDLSRERTHDRRTGICYRDGHDVVVGLIKARLGRECRATARDRMLGPKLPRRSGCPQMRRNSRPALDVWICYAVS